MALEPSTRYSREIFIKLMDPCSPKSTTLTFSLRTAPEGIVPNAKRLLSVPADGAVFSLTELLGYSIIRSARSNEELFLLVIPMISDNSSPPAVKLFPSTEISMFSFETVLPPAKKP